MNKWAKPRWIAIAAALCATATLWAHHSVTAVFDTSQHINITGQLTDVEWVNPHIFLHLKAKADGPEALVKVQEWKVEGGPPMWYRRVNVNKATFTKHLGETVKIDGYPSKDVSPYGYLLKITFADGDSLESINASDAAKGK